MIFNRLLERFGKCSRGVDQGELSVWQTGMADQKEVSAGLI